MKKFSINLLASSLAVLLVSSVDCVRASFDPIPVVTGGAGAGGAGGSGSGGQIAGAGGGAGAADSGTCPATPVLTCSTPTTTDPCDPVCRTGSKCDWCTQKCTYALLGATVQATCAAKDPSPVAVFQYCGVTYSGLSAQDDNCAPGSICLQPYNGGNPSNGYCFALCRNAVQDCNGVACTPRMLSSKGGTVNVCDPPYSQCGPDGNCCDPLATTQPSGCDSGRVCLLVPPEQSSGPSRTVCEFSSGDGKNGAFCASAHDCALANTCVNDGLHNGCHRVCDLTTHPCPVGTGDCLLWGAEYGFCPNG